VCVYVLRAAVSATGVSYGTLFYLCFIVVLLTAYVLQVNDDDDDDDDDDKLTSYCTGGGLT